MGQPFVGEIRQFAGNYPPNGWALCDGQVLSIAENEVLFQLIGTTYGGDGEELFALPDLRGRVPIHMENTVIGESAGTETVTLTSSQMPAHTHPPSTSDASGSDDPEGKFWAKSGTSRSYATPAGDLQMNPQSISPAGGSQPHENRVPFVAVSYIISLYGLFPSPG
jgi:microcystin-dependent protein